MKSLVALSVCAFVGMAAPAFAQDTYGNTVDTRTAPGGMNNRLSPAEQHGGGMIEGRSAAPDAYNNTYDNGGQGANGVDHRSAPGGLNNGLSPGIQHAD